MSTRPRKGPAPPSRPPHLAPGELMLVDDDGATSLYAGQAAGPPQRLAGPPAVTTGLAGGTRALGTVYQASETRLVIVSVYAHFQVAPNGEQESMARARIGATSSPATLVATAGGAMWVDAADEAVDTMLYDTLVFAVPAGYYYEVVDLGVTLQHWVEVTL